MDDLKSIKLPRLHSLVVWIRRELRVGDNLPLFLASQDADRILPLYVVDPAEMRLIAPAKAKIIVESLTELRSNLRSLGSDLIVRTGNPHEVLMQFLHQTKSAGVYLSKSYEPNRRRQDSMIRSAVVSAGKIWRDIKDQVLFEETELLAKGSAGPYTIFTNYKRAWLERQHEIPPILPPIATLQPLPSLEKGRIPSLEDLGIDISGRVYPSGGESAARRAAEIFLQGTVEHYHENRDSLHLEGTSRLSHHLSLGTLSVRSLYHLLRGREQPFRGLKRQGSQAFLSQLIWRDFYYQIVANFPYVEQGSFRKQFDAMRWSSSTSHFQAWCDGCTGYPIIDAAMRQLNQTGWMHNRARMIVASFLTKDLHIDWRQGEKYFFSQLADGDMALNNGGWQWSAGTGTDAQPWFRIFNPQLQSKKFDPEGAYIRKYVPELNRVPAKYIHEPSLMPPSVQEKIGVRIGRDYPFPIVEHEVERKKTIKYYSEIGD